MKKKLTAWLLSLVFVMTLLPANAALADVPNPTMTLTTARAAGKNLTLSIQAANPDDLANVWVDLNGNGTKEMGEDTVGSYKQYTIASPTVTVYGKVTVFNCQNSELTALDVSENPYLTELICSGNQLAALDVTQNAALTKLECRSNLLTELTVTQNAALTRLDTYSNALEALDLTHNTLLAYLNCSNNNLSGLNVTQNTALTTLNCSANPINILNIDSNTLITNLQCANCGLSALDVSNLRPPSPSSTAGTMP
jgi:hypothetical protein